MRDQADIQREQQWHELERNLPLEAHSLYRKILPTVQALTPGRILEVGCLDGKLLKRLKAEGWEVKGLDIQPQEEDFILLHDAAKPFPFPPGQFDVVVAAEVIEHVVDTREFLRHCADMLCPGGMLIVTTPNLLFGVNRLLMLAGRRPRICYADFHVRMFVWDDLREKLAERFTDIRLRGSHVLVGRHRGRWAEIFSVLGDRFPQMAAHFIVTARLPFGNL